MGCGVCKIFMCTRREYFEHAVEFMVVDFLITGGARALPEHDLRRRWPERRTRRPRLITYNKRPQRELAWKVYKRAYRYGINTFSKLGMTEDTSTVQSGDLESEYKNIYTIVLSPICTFDVAQSFQSMSGELQPRQSIFFVFREQRA